MNERGKSAAAQAAAQLVEPGMVIGIGTGSTAAYLIDALIERVQQGLFIRAFATSRASEQLAAAGGVPILEAGDDVTIDLTIDGADQIDPLMRMIKGGGGALFREKMIATQSRKMAVIVDASKQVAALGGRPLPVEVAQFGWQWTKQRVAKLGFSSTLRMEEGAPYITDNGNYILDLDLPAPLDDPKQTHMQLIQTVGVVETGLFFELASTVFVGSEDGTAERIDK